MFIFATSFIYCANSHTNFYLKHNAYTFYYYPVLSVFSVANLIFSFHGRNPSCSNIGFFHFSNILGVPKPCGFFSPRM